MGSRAENRENDREGGIGRRRQIADRFLTLGATILDPVQKSSAIPSSRFPFRPNLGGAPLLDGFGIQGTDFESCFRHYTKIHSDNVDRAELKAHRFGDFEGFIEPASR